jgi:hypothetical protein
MLQLMLNLLKCYTMNDIFVIIKNVSLPNNRILPVIMLNEQGEVWEFDDKDKVQEMVNILNTNTDSGHKYEIKKI